MIAFLKSIIRFWKKLLISIIALMILIILICDSLVSIKSNKYLHNTIDDLPENKVGLLLGTSKYLKGGAYNEFYKNRIDAAVLLYNSGKIRYILVSGDNSTMSYNEPVRMLTDLLANGIPREHIFLDYAGFRTFDSMVRCKKVFQENEVTVISQKFHNQRAVFIGRVHDMEAIGFNAMAVSSHSSIKTKIREKFARVKLMIDLLTNKQPKFLGEPIVIE